jgi:DNA-binding transcriptional MerR regulator
MPQSVGPRTPIPIGEVARRSGVAASALRYYERAGLIPRADRQGGRRVYGEDVLDRLALIRVAKAAGFRVADCRCATLATCARTLRAHLT